MITDKSRYGHDAVLDLNCGDSVQVLRTEPMTLTEQEQKIVQKYLGIALLEKSYIDANGHLMVVLSDGRTLDVGSARGLSGATPYLGENGNWFVEGVDTLQSARGLPGFTPYIGENEHWWIDETDTGIPARGIPLTEKADNTRFLRNDGTWQKVTPENIGAAKQSDFAAQKSIVTDHTTRIEALEQRTVTAPYYTDDSVAYIKEVPENALPFASVDMVGGMTRKCTNLLPLNDMETTILGCAVRVSNGVITINGTATGAGGRLVSIGTMTLPAGTYILTTEGTSDGNFFLSRYGGDSEIVGFINIPFTLTEETKLIFGYNFTSGRTYTVRITARVNAGDTALPYEPHFDGLRSAPATEAESALANLQKTVNGTHKLKPGAYITFENGHFDLNLNSSTVIEISSTLWRQYTGLKLRAGTYTVSISNFKSSKSVAFYLVNATKLEDITIFRVVDFNSYTFTLDTEAEIYIGAYVYFPDGVNETISGDIMLNKGTTALPYKPYRSDTLPVPAEVQALDGYGWGINESVYNYIDFEKKRFAKRVERIDMGTMLWTTYTDDSSGSSFFFSNTDLPDRKFGSGEGTLLCAPYKAVRYRSRLEDKCISPYNDVNNNHMCVKDSSYTDAATFKAAMSGVMLYYELAEPVITDISDLLPDDNLIRVERGGTVTMVNEYGYDVPSEITYARLTWQ